MPGDGKEEKVGLRFLETMSGYLAEGVEDFEEGERKGREQGNTLSFDVTIEVESVSDFINLLLADPIKDLFFQKTKEGIFDQDLNRKLYELFRQSVQ